jgi:hypothetical protein
VNGSEVLIHRSILLDLINLMVFGEEYNSSSSKQLSSAPYCFISLRPECSRRPILKYPKSILFLTAKDQVSHTYKVMGKIVVLYVLIPA